MSATPITDSIAFNLTATMQPNTNVEALKYVLGKMREMELELIEVRKALGNNNNHRLFSKT